MEKEYRIQVIQEDTVVMRAKSFDDAVQQLKNQVNPRALVTFKEIVEAEVADGNNQSAAEEPDEEN